MRSHAPIQDVVGASGLIQPIEIKQDRHASLGSMEDEEAWMARRRASLARMRRKRQSRRAGANRLGFGSGWTDGEIEAFDDMNERFPIVEEDDEF